ncbi:hypothetical protein [Novosphingobium sp. FSW06-99]|uniref:hypothetical protein n=1 Tax=Novosphingobium sp. FSW06-99 TaxID=1739113 RepID=UPI00076D7854|nr:hypothetical protein [Novosphingobium sp. FSW06-99]KUR80738.1 hypothetical protein AQZ49_01540 [Novosphingobium sp. FSW06-99]
MLTAILSLFKGWSILSSIGAWFTDAWAWAAKNPLAAAVAALVLICAVLGWYAHHEAATATKARADEAQAEKALTVEQASNARLQAALDAQNAAVAQLGKDSTTDVTQGNQADAAALARSAQRAAEAQAIVIPPAANGKPGCPTPADVIAAKKDL